MARNGAGVFTLTDGTRSGANVCQQQKAAGIDVTASLMDNILSDVGTAITNSLAANGETTVTANIPLAGFKLTNIGAATTATDATRADQVQNGALLYAGSAGGTANALTVTLTPTPSSYTAGMVIRVVATATNTGAATINVNSLGIRDIRTKRSGAVALGASAIINGGIYDLIYDGTQFRLLSDDEGIKSWTPTYSGSGSLTFTSVTTQVAQFRRIGNVVHFWFRATGTTGGTGTTINVTAPTNISTLSGDVAMGTIVDDGGITTAFVTYNSTSHLFTFTKTNVANWGAGGSRLILASGSYEAA